MIVARDGDELAVRFSSPKLTFDEGKRQIIVGYSNTVKKPDAVAENFPRLNYLLQAGSDRTRGNWRNRI